MATTQSTSSFESVQLRLCPEEMANSVTHGIGLVLSIVASVPLLLAATKLGNMWIVAGCVIFSLALIAVYSASALSHAVQEPQSRQRFRTLDQAVIYLLIVGTFTPFALAYLRTGSGWLLLTVMWAGALAGFIAKAFFEHRIESVSTWSYITLGWIPVLAVKPLFNTLTPQGLAWVLAGGLCYTIGTAFLKLDNRVPFFHAAWHVTVIAGSICHYIAVYCYVLPWGYS